MLERAMQFDLLKQCSNSYLSSYLVGKDGLPGLALIGGVDISFIKDDEVNACAGYVVWYVPLRKLCGFSEFDLDL